LVASGNSFAAPHISGLAALVRSKHPQLTSFELKAVLAAVSMSTPPDPVSPESQ
jgi:subtilisin family serine protease